jgi:hypothetical protein
MLVRRCSQPALTLLPTLAKKTFRLQSLLA